MCFAVFYNSKQLRVFENFDNARMFAIGNANKGYHCQIEEFSFSYIIGVLVFDTTSPFKA